jgi:nicotinamidase-related amidase
MKTLLIIDMQNAWLARAGQPCFDTPGVTARINRAADRVRSEGGRVIFIQHADEDAPVGSPAWDIIAALTVAPGDGRVQKTACDSFGDTDLAAQLQANETDAVYVCGFATEFCVDTALRAAASRGLRVIALSDAHTTANRPHLNADAIVAHHNWIWANFSAPAGGSLCVQTTAQAFPA